MNPFSSLDWKEKSRFCRLLERHRAGICIIFTHEQMMILLRADHIWEIIDGRLYERGQLPDAISRWCTAPPVIKYLLGKGEIPANVSPGDIEEALCRTRGEDYFPVRDYHVQRFSASRVLPVHLSGGFFYTTIIVD